MAGERMTQPASAATLPVIRALLDEASRKNYGGGMLGVRARPEWTTAPEFNSRRDARPGGALRVGACRLGGDHHPRPEPVARRHHRP